MVTEHHVHQLGQPGGSQIIDPDAVTDTPEKIVGGNILPTEMTICGRTYDILGFQQGDEESVFGLEMVERAKEMRAHLGQDDGQYLLNHQEEIPEVLRYKVVFFLTDWRDPNSPNHVACIYYDDNRWVKGWSWLLRFFRDRVRWLRRKSGA